VAYQLWGTALVQSRQQHALRLQFEGLVHRHRVASGGPDPSRPGPPPAVGQPVGILQIPSIGVDQVVVEGVSAPQLARGPGHYPGTPLPGQPGNAGIAGHRTTHSAPFYDLNELTAGDAVTVTTLQGIFHYRVVRSEVVLPTDRSVLAPTSTPELTLTTCTPRYSAARRLVVVSRLVSTPAPATPGPSGAAGTDPDPDPLHQAANWMWLAVWGVACAGLVVAVGVARRRGGRRGAVLAPLVAAPVAVVLLFFFFGAINAMLPQAF